MFGVVVNSEAKARSVTASRARRPRPKAECRTPRPAHAVRCLGTSYTSYLVTRTPKHLHLSSLKPRHVHPARTVLNHINSFKHSRICRQLRSHLLSFRKSLGRAGWGDRNESERGRSCGHNRTLCECGVSRNASRPWLTVDRRAPDLATTEIQWWYRLPSSGPPTRRNT